MAEIDLLKLRLLQSEQATLVERSQTFALLQREITAEHAAKSRAIAALVESLAKAAGVSLDQWEVDIPAGAWKRKAVPATPAR